MTLPGAARAVLDEGALCYLAAPDEPAPHLTPVVYALEGGRVWATTARRSRKARLWRGRPAAAGLVRAAGRAVTFRGGVATYDALSPSTWPRSVLRGPTLARASARFTVRNLRFFAGYARDAHRVPLAWTPPGRIFLSVRLAEGAVVDPASGEVAATWGAHRGEAGSRSAFRALAGGTMPDERVPEDVLRLVGESGEGALAVASPNGITVLPVRWLRAPDEGVHYMALPARLLALAGAGSEFPASLVADRSSAWRAAEMAGVLLRGPAEAFVPARVRSGRSALLERGRGLDLDAGAAVVRLRAEQAVWWKGWGSGTVVRP